MTPQQIKYYKVLLLLLNAYSVAYRCTLCPGHREKYNTTKSKKKITTISSPYRNLNATIGLCMFLWEYYSAFSLYGRFRQAYNAIISSNKGPVYRVYQHKLFEKIERYFCNITSIKDVV